MAEHLVFPFNVKLHLHRNIVEEPLLVPTNLQIRKRRKYYSGSCKSFRFSSWSAKKLASHLMNVKISRLQNSLTKCFCLNALVEADNATLSDWVPVADQVLLMASMFLTCIAGVVPIGKPLTYVRDDNSNGTVLKNSNLLGSCRPKQNDEVNLRFAWDIVEVKLLDSLDAVKRGVTVVSGVQEEFAMRPSSLLALTEFPRLRLLWASFQWLRKQVNNLSGNCIGSDEEILMDFMSIIQNSCQPLCMMWLEEELRAKNSTPDKKLLLSVSRKLNGSDSILQYIRKSGKEYLYLELILTLECGSARMSGYYDSSLFIQHGVALLEDLVITIADGIASMYLELISVDSSTSSEMNSLGLNLCSLSTRALQKLRNEVALHQWLHQNMESVVSMYEDRFDLRTFQRRDIEEPSKSKAENFKWWQRLGMRRSMPLSPGLSFVVISPVSVSVKRTKELRALNGWQYYFSLFLELADIAMPLVRTVIAKVSDAISFFLVCLIGRSLGLIYTGIRQSLRWK